MVLLKTLTVVLILMFLTSEKFALKSRYKNKHKTLNKVLGQVISSPSVTLGSGLTIIPQLRKTVDESKDYYAFRRIPYAEPPVGNRRFRPPEPLQSNLTHVVIDSTQDTPPCVQTDTSGQIIGSEDCLYINVYTPRLNRTNGTLFAVMVWIYGGGFINGDASYRSYGPDFFLDEENVIVVTLNYRLGVFGFLSTQDDASPGNYGLKDQVLALRWIKANIQAFGGDPDKITVFGESAGAVFVSYLSQTKLTKGLFQRAIMQSGTSLNLWSLTRKPYVIASIIATSLGVNLTSSQTMVDGLRVIDYKALQVVAAVTYFTILIAGNPLDGLPFGPTMEPSLPGAVLVNDSHQQLSNGLFYRVPYIIGLNSQESKPFIDASPLIPLYFFKYDLYWASLVPASLNVKNTIVKDIVNAVIKLRYFGTGTVGDSVPEEIQFVSDNEFNRPIIEAGRQYSKQSPVYFYVFSYQRSTERKTPGVGHAEELQFFWYQPQNVVNNTPLDELTRRRLVKIWVNFGKTGNPTPSSDPLLQNVTWPQVDGSSNNLVYLDIGGNLTVRANPFQERMAFWYRLFSVVGNPPYSTY